jgi:ubiquinone/menaquinone biosynthesis C-methylase UbiE
MKSVYVEPGLPFHVTAACPVVKTKEQKMNDDAGFWNRTAEKYAAQPLDDEAAYQKKLEMTRALLTPGSRVIEFGCGTGTTALHHAPFAQHILATDISEKMIEIAWSKAQEQGIENVTFEVGGLDNPDLAGQQFDMVMMHSLLHLLRNPGAGIAKAHDLLKSGGYFVSSTACLSGTMRLLQPFLAIGRLFGAVPYVAFFSQRHLSAALRTAGFEIVQEWLPEGHKAVFIIARKP